MTAALSPVEVEERRDLAPDAAPPTRRRRRAVLSVRSAVGLGVADQPGRAADQRERRGARRAGAAAASAAAPGCRCAGSARSGRSRSSSVTGPAASAARSAPRSVTVGDQAAPGELVEDVGHGGPSSRRTSSRRTVTGRRAARRSRTRRVRGRALDHTVPDLRTAGPPDGTPTPSARRRARTARARPGRPAGRRAARRAPGPPASRLPPLEPQRRAGSQTSVPVPARGRCRAPAPAGPGRAPGRGRRARPAGAAAQVADPVDDLAGAQQHRRRPCPSAPADDVGAPVHAVGEVDVDVAGGAEHDRVARGRARGRRASRGLPAPAYASTSVSRTATHRRGRRATVAPSSAGDVERARTARGGAVRTNDAARRHRLGPRLGRIRTRYSAGNRRGTAAVRRRRRPQRRELLGDPRRARCRRGRRGRRASRATVSTSRTSGVRCARDRRRGRRR